MILSSLSQDPKGETRIHSIYKEKYFIGVTSFKGTLKVHKSYEVLLQERVSMVKIT